MRLQKPCGGKDSTIVLRRLPFGCAIVWWYAQEYFPSCIEFDRMDERLVSVIRAREIKLLPRMLIKTLPLDHEENDIHTAVTDIAFAIDLIDAELFGTRSKPRATQTDSEVLTSGK